MGDFRGPRAGAGGQGGGGLSGAQTLAAYKLKGDHFMLKHLHDSPSAFQLKMSLALSFMT